MKYLIVYASPNPQSFCKEITEKLVETLQEMKRQVVVSDLYAKGFNPVLDPSDFTFMNRGDYAADVKDEQELIREASVVFFIYPIWWLGPPAIMKGYFDRVFAEGFAYSRSETGIDKGFSGKKAVVINVMGVKEDVYEKSGALNAMMKVTDEGILAYTGLQVVDHLFLGEVHPGDIEKRESLLKVIPELIKKLTEVNADVKNEPVW